MLTLVGLMCPIIVITPLRLSPTPPRPLVTLWGLVTLRGLVKAYRRPPQTSRLAPTPPRSTLPLVNLRVLVQTPIKTFRRLAITPPRKTMPLTPRREVSIPLKTLRGLVKPSRVSTALTTLIVILLRLRF